VTTAPGSLEERRMIWLLAAIQFMQILDFVLMMPLGPQLMRLFELTPGDFGLLISVYMFGAATSGLVASAVVDRFDRRKVLLTLIAGFAAAALATAASPGYAALVAAHATAGGCGGVLGMQVHAVIGDTIPDGRRGAATGVVMSAFAMASVAGVPIALVLADVAGWRAPFAVLAAGALMLLALTLRTLPPLAGHLHARGGGHVLASTRAVFAEPNHRHAFLLVAFVMFAGFSVIPYSAPYFVKNVGLKESEISVLWFFGGLATMFTSRWIGRQIDLRGKQRVFRAVALLSCAPILITTHLPPVPLPVVVLASVLFMTIVSGRFVPVMAMVNAAAQPRLRGSFLSVSGAVQQASAGCASFVGGLIIGYGPAGELTRYGWVGWFAVAMTLAAVSVARRVRSVS
jgi:predicted MFS family arabinose efflux permease